MPKKFLVCIDSDGCVFDTMEVKHKECFCPAYVNFFNLQAVSKYARDAWDFVNLYSADRGIHRIPSLLKSLQLISERKEVKERGFNVPELKELREYYANGGSLSNDGIQKYIDEHPESDEMRNVLQWSYDVNKRVGELVRNVPPFPGVRECLAKLSEVADIVIVSATQHKALEREWAEHDLLQYVTAVKGQEAGNKREIIASLLPEYPENHVLMVGDAPGDLAAAHANGAMFYPICPEQEVESWAKFDKNIEAFLAENYKGTIEDENIAYFNQLLTSEVPWN